MAPIKGKYLSVTSFKRDGTAIATPVWFVADDGHLLVETDAESGKARRIRHNATMTVAECAASGKLKGERIAAHAEFLPESERGRVEGLMAEKYRLDRIFVLPVYRLVQRLRGTPVSEGKPVILEITPD